MAVDTATKRASLLGLVLPDGSIDAGDRMTLVRLYSGITASSAAASHTVDGIFAAIHPILGRFEAQHDLAGVFGATHAVRGIF